MTGLENIPASGPVIIIANHASSLMDAALLGILLKRPAYFFARGDVFVNKPVQKILSWFHMMPVHNHEAGRHTIKDNHDSFFEGQQILSRGGIVVFFPESASHTERQLLPFRKGVFRLAFKTAADNGFSFEIPIIPVGITYEHPVACRTEVQVHVFNPLLLSAYQNAYKENPAAALLRISKDAWLLINKKVLHIENKSRLQTTEYCLTLNRNNCPTYLFPWKITSATQLEQEQTICRKINSAAEAGFRDIQEQSNSYFNELAKYRLNDKTLAPGFAFTAWKKIILWAGFPFYLTGLLLNALPVFIARFIADKKVYRADFYSWIFVVCYSFLYFCWLIILLTTSIFFGWQYSIVLLALMILTGIFSYVYRDWLKEAGQQEKLKQLTASQVIHFRNARDAVLKAL